MLNCCLLTQAVLFMKYNQRMFMIIFLSTSIYLILVTIQKIQSFLILLIKKLLVIGKMKDKSEGKIIDEFVGLDSKWFSIEILMVKNLIQQKE